MQGTAETNHVKLTKPQLAELQRMSEKPQCTFGSGRVRVQNNLVAMGLAGYVDEQGKPIRTDPFAAGYCPASWLADRCAITDAGKSLLRGQG